VDLDLANDTIQIVRDELAAAIRYDGWDRIKAIDRRSLKFMSHACSIR